MAMPITTDTPIIPTQTLENFFGLHLTNECATAEGGERITVWTNPYLQQVNAFATPILSAITPYIPGRSQQFAFNAPLELLSQDVTVTILSKLDLKNLLNCSSVCKSFYSASKANFIWGIQLWNLLPNVTNVAPNLCIFTHEQQYKVIFKRIQNECKPYTAKFTRNQEISNNMLDQLKTLELQFQEAGGKEAASRFNKQQIKIYWQNVVQGYESALNIAIQNFPDDYHAAQLKRSIDELQGSISYLSGANYDGTIESIDKNSEQGKILNAINIMVPNAFDNQEMFESVIEKSVAAQNNSSSNNDGPTIEDVTDVADNNG